MYNQRHLRKWAVLLALLTVVSGVRAESLDDQLADDDSKMDESSLVFTSLQPEPEDSPQEVQPPAPRPRLFTRGLLGTRQPTRLQRAPAMFGDLFFGGGFFSNGFSTISIAGGDRTFKIAENNSPLPADRCFYDYNHFHNAVLADGAVASDENVDRHVFGVEKTWLGGCWSTELRVPVVDGLDNVQDPLFGGRESVEFGNMSLAVKRLLCETECRAWSIGCAVVFPTAADAGFDNAGVRLFNVENTAYHLQPFIGWLFTPNERCFFEGFMQFDFDANGNRVTPVAVNVAGTLNDQTLMMIDGKLGYWLHDDPCARVITGIAPFVEMHYTTTLQDADTFNGLGNPFNHVDVLNLTAGLHFELGPFRTLNVAAVVPLRDDEEKLFDAEFGIQFTRFF